MLNNVAERLGTDTPLIQTLIAEIHKGEIKIPQFQRKFVWKPEQALQLLDSIGNSYPIGSLLLWRTRTKLTVERNIGDFHLPKTDDLSPTNYVLDGQQRLTVIYSCLGASEESGGFAVMYDLIQEKFVEMSNNLPNHKFPLRLLYKTTKLLNFRTELMNHSQAIELQKKLDSLINAFTNYRIPVVTLKELSVEEVCPIFERVNSSGTRLSTYDLLVAATWSEQFNLNDEIETITKSLKPKGFGDIEGDTVLKCLSAIHNLGIKKQQILSLRELNNIQMEKLVNKTKEALLKTVDLLSTEFKIYSWDFLPYEALAVILCYLYSNINRLEQQHINRIRKWFWSSSFSARYRGASDTFLSKDLEAVNKFVLLQDGKADSFGFVPSQNELKELVFRSNGSVSRAFILALATKNPKNITNGIAIDTSNALSIFNKKQFHHIYPQAYLKTHQIIQEHNTILNICMLAASENNAISDSDPNCYLPNCITMLGDQVERVFESNLLPNPNFTDYSCLTYEDFLDKRASLVHELMLSLCEA